jgi:hypothetical protein
VPANPKAITASSRRTRAASRLNESSFMSTTPCLPALWVGKGGGHRDRIPSKRATRTLNLQKLIATVVIRHQRGATKSVCTATPR